TTPGIDGATVSVGGGWVGVCCAATDAPASDSTTRNSLMGKPPRRISVRLAIHAQARQEDCLDLPLAVDALVGLVIVAETMHHARAVLPSQQILHRPDAARRSW